MKQHQGDVKNDNSKVQVLDEDHHWKDEIFNFLDSHVREVRYGIYGLGILGCVLIFRSTRITTQFTSVSQIPKNFIKRNVTLQGKVRYVTTTGSLLTLHQPILQLPAWLSFQKQGGLLPVEIISVAVTPSGRKWLIENLKDKHIWFTLIRSSETAVECIVFKKVGYLKKLNVNEELVKTGAAKVHFNEHAPFPETDVHGRVLAKLLKLESVAERKGLGMWQSEEDDRKTGLFKKVKNILSFPFKYFKKRKSN